MDSLSQLPHGGGSTPTDVADGQPCPGAATVTDVDNNTYNTVKIGDQCWTKENLRTKTHTSGNVYTNPNIDSVVYGRLYDWDAVMQGAESSSSVPSNVQGICPEGWHVPSNAEWTVLTTYVSSKTEYQCNGNDNIANALSAATGWENSTTNGCNAGCESDTRNLTGFSAVAAGYFDTGSQSGGSEAHFWSATQDRRADAWYRGLSSGSAGVNLDNGDKYNGRSVRCVRDAGIGGTPGSNETGSGGGETAVVDTITCYPNLGTNTPVKKTVTRGQSIDLAATFTHPVQPTNWEIAGWNTSADGTGTPYTNQVTTTGNVTLYAQWRTFCTITNPLNNTSEIGSSGRVDTLKDVEGNQYAVVQIDDQCWMKQNLRTSNVNSHGNVYTNSDVNVVSYGRYYDWAAVMQGAASSENVPSGVRGICPAGWHVPSDAEWTTLTTYVNSKTEYQCNGNGNIANALSAATGWDKSSTSGCNAGYESTTRNLTGFSGVPAGVYINNNFYTVYELAGFWSATPEGSGEANCKALRDYDMHVYNNKPSKSYGYSVRCLRDASMTITSDPSSDTVKMCGQTSVSVTYTANLEGGTADAYSWNVNGTDSSSVTGSTLTVHYTTTGEYTVSCTAAGAAASKTVTIENSGTPVTLGLCESCNEGSITVKVNTNVASIVWRNAAGDSVSNTTTTLTQSGTIPAGVYTATASSADGCQVTRTATLGRAVAHPCTVTTSLRAGTALDDGKYANKEYGSGTQLDSVSDHQGNVYRVTQIGGQCWLAENMRATTSPSTEHTILMNMKSSYSSKSASYYNGNADTYGKYGVLYNWCAAVDTFYNDGRKSHPELANTAGHSSSTWTCDMPAGNRRGVCPAGWHVPTNDEWNTLTTAAIVGVGSGKTGAGKLAGGCDWNSTEAAATGPSDYSYADRDSTGFSALPASTYNGGQFVNVGNNAFFWSATPSDQDCTAYTRRLAYHASYVTSTIYGRNLGFSVRCLRD